MAKQEVILAQKVECKRCSHRWLPRVAEIVACPSCHSPYWNREKTYKPRKKASTEE